MRKSIDPTDVQSANSLVQALRRARRIRGYSLRDLATKAGASYSSLSAYENGVKSPTLKTYLKLIDACDLALDVELRPRIREVRAQARGDELIEVLRLAEQFPPPDRTQSRAPNFGRLMSGT